jgi:hypothetical protein
VGGLGAREPGTRADRAIAAAAAAAVEDAGVPLEMLGDYLDALVAVADTRRRLTRRELDACRARGAAAAAAGVPLPALIDAHLTAAWRAWDGLPAVGAARGTRALASTARAVLRAVDDAASALADGYDAARRDVIRREEAFRREFIDDLLAGRGDVEYLVERAERFGLSLAGPHLVTVAAAGDGEPPFTDGGGPTRRVEAEVLHRFGGHDVLVATKSGLLVCIVTAAAAGVTNELAALLHGIAGLQVGVGRPRAGPGGVARSYEEAREALDLARRLGLDDPVVEAAGLLVYRMLLRDRGAIVELVDAVLSPLQGARGGPRPLLETLAAYFQAGAVVAEAARRLHVGVRTVSYRLERIRSLTGYAATDPAHRFTLEAAVLGARLLDWPATALPRVEE